LLVIDAVNVTAPLLVGCTVNVVDEVPLWLPLAAPLQLICQPALY
jgi:hypothetical protein